MDNKEPTQETRAKKGGPITIPVPTRDAIDTGTSKAPVSPKPSKKDRKRIEDAAARERARKRSGEDG